jgi:hypothetical protein
VLDRREFGMTIFRLGSPNSNSHHFAHLPRETAAQEGPRLSQAEPAPWAQLCCSSTRRHGGPDISQGLDYLRQRPASTLQIATVDASYPCERLRTFAHRFTIRLWSARLTFAKASLRPLKPGAAKPRAVLAPEPEPAAPPRAPFAELLPSPLLGPGDLPFPLVPPFSAPAPRPAALAPTAPTVEPAIAPSPPGAPAPVPSSRPTTTPAPTAACAATPLFPPMPAPVPTPAPPRP